MSSGSAKSSRAHIRAAFALHLDTSALALRSLCAASGEHVGEARLATAINATSVARRLPLAGATPPHELVRVAIRVGRAAVLPLVDHDARFSRHFCAKLLVSRRRGLSTAPRTHQRLFFRAPIAG